LAAPEEIHVKLDVNLDGCVELSEVTSEKNESLKILQNPRHLVTFPQLDARFASFAQPQDPLGAL
jgi:hypothetical protein